MTMAPAFFWGSFFPSQYGKYKAHFLFTWVSQIRRTNPPASAATRSSPYQPSPTRFDTGFPFPPQTRGAPVRRTTARCGKLFHLLSSSLRLHAHLNDEANGAACTRSVL